MKEEELYGIAWKILDGHVVEGIEQHKIEQLADKIVAILRIEQIPVNVSVSKPLLYTNERNNEIECCHNKCPFKMYNEDYEQNCRGEDKVTGDPMILSCCEYRPAKDC